MTFGDLRIGDRFTFDGAPLASGRVDAVKAALSFGVGKFPANAIAEDGTRWLVSSNTPVLPSE